MAIGVSNRNPKLITNIEMVLLVLVYPLLLEYKRKQEHTCNPCKLTLKYKCG